MTTKLESTVGRLTEWFNRFDQPVVMSSFGKDSMVMLFIIFRLMHKRIPVIYHGVPWEPWKNDFASGVTKAYHLTVYDYPPIMSGVRVKPERLEIVHRYQIGKDWGHGIDIPVNLLPPDKNWQCGLKMVSRPKGTLLYQWNLTLIGHKSCDVDQFDGHMPLKSDLVEMDGFPALGFPLKDWSDDELWEFIEERHVPVQHRTRYVDRKEIEDKTLNNDYVEACTACIDPRNPEKVFCPLVNREIDNVSASVQKFEGRAVYIGGADHG
ncbi:MAG: hypothetical protein C5B54_00490 [Acidobacteria bacterium]|nr:MAG: hypothetical protein C5B54_00490 [Acidobacteriota bacterium]